MNWRYMETLTTTNVLLAVMAVVQVLWIVAALVAALYVRGIVARVEAALVQFEQGHVRPLRTKVDHILNDVTLTTGAVQQRAATVEAGLVSSYHVAERQARRVASALNALARETTAVASGVRAAVAAVAEPTPTTSNRGARRDLHA